MSKLYDYLKFGFDIRADEIELQEIRDIVLEEAGFKWIPVSERLPEPGKPILISTKEGHITRGWYSSIKTGRWALDDCDGATGVLAWMPLPKPYDPQP